MGINSSRRLGRGNRPVTAVAAGIFVGLLAAVSACSDQRGPGGPSDSGVDQADVGGDPLTERPGGTLSGVVRDTAGVVVTGAKIGLGAASVFTDSQGRYTLDNLSPGPTLVQVTRAWFKPLEANVTIEADLARTLDLTIEEMPLAIDPADLALATTYAASFDWTKQTLSIAVVPRPTRRDFDNAVYLHNPALYRDTSNEAPLTPTPLPQIVGGAATSFSFPVRSGASQGQEALDVATIVDASAGTPLGASEPSEFMIWTPLVNWLTEWDAAKAADLRGVGVAVRQQNWGGNALRPQEIEKAYLDASGGLWVKVVFARFVQLGPGISDDDGDGLKEVYAKVASRFVSAEVVQKLGGEYARTTFNTHGLSKEVAKSLNELYSTTAAQVERFIGQPFEVPGLGTIRYPFVVLRHSGGQKNVLLVAPGP